MRIFLYSVLFVIVLLTSANAQWVSSNQPNNNAVYSSMAFIDGKLFSGTDYGIHRSTNGGYTWTAFNTGNTASYINGFTYDGTNIFVAADIGVLVSTPNGSSWTLKRTGIPTGSDYAIQSILYSNGTLIAATKAKGVYLSTNGGDNWTVSNSGLSGIFAYNTYALHSHGGNVFIGTQSGVYKSTNNGANWSLATNTIAGLYGAFATLGNDLFATGYSASSNSGIGKSTDGGATWAGSNSGITLNTIFDAGSILAVNGTLFCGVLTGYSAQSANCGVYTSTNHGDTWTAINTGLPANYNVVRTLCANDTNVFLGQSGALWKRTISTITSVRSTNELVPSHYSLSQNYPNPFNPTTKINFSLPTEGYVTLKIYDMLGREVTTLVSEDLHAGNFSTAWNATGVVSGVYVYRIQAGEFTETKRLVLMR